MTSTLHETTTSQTAKPVPRTRRFHWRAFVSVIAAVSFFALVATGVVLFITPPGRVANWTSWRLLSIAKEQWGGLHIWFSVIFVLAAFFHLILNWRAFLSYFRGKLSKSFALRFEWLIALLLCVGVGWATLIDVTPFSTLLAWNSAIKNSWETPQKRAPVPHAELLSLADLARTTEGLNADTMVKNLQAAGIAISSPAEVLGDLARTNGRTAMQLYDIAVGQNAADAGGRGAGAGLGQMTLQQYCTRQNLNLEAAIAKLRGRGFSAAGELTMREIAVSGGIHPSALRDILAQ